MKWKAKELEKETHERRDITWMTIAACAWLGLFPLINFGTYATLTRDKWVCMMVLTGVTVGCMIADACAHHVRKLPGKACVLAGLLLAWMVMSCIASPADASVWWMGRMTRREGLATQLCYFLLFFLFSGARVERRPALVAASTGVLLFGIIVMLQRAGYNPLSLYPSGLSFSTNPEFQGTIGNVDMCSGYLVIILGILGTDLLQKSMGKGEETKQAVRFSGGMLTFLTVAGLGMALFLLVSMGVQFGLISLACCLLYLALRSIPRRFRLLTVVLLLIMIFLVLWLVPFDMEGIWEIQEILHGRTQLSFGSNRLAVWYYSMQLVKEDLLFGGGCGTFRERLESYLIENRLEMPFIQGEKLIPTIFDNPHNEYVALLVNHGLPALVLYCALLFYLCFRPLLENRTLLRRKNSEEGNEPGKALKLDVLKEDMRSGAMGYIAQAFFSFSVCIVAPIYWVVMGMLAADRE